jgi:hypothetical protein
MRFEGIGSFKVLQCEEGWLFFEEPEGSLSAMVLGV